MKTVEKVKEVKNEELISGNDTGKLEGYGESWVCLISRYKIFD